MLLFKSAIYIYIAIEAGIKIRKKAPCVTVKVCVSIDFQMTLSNDADIRPLSLNVMKRACWNNCRTHV